MKSENLMSTIQKNLPRFLFYFVGMVILAFGLTMNSKVDLGVSPIMSIAFAISKLYPISFADATLIEYIFLVAIELVIHFIKKKRLPYFLVDLAQIPFSFVFSRFVGLYVNLIPNFATDLAGTIYGGIPFRFLMLLIAIVTTGIGAILMVDMSLIPNPGDGAVQAVASILQKDIPYTKVRFDCVCLISTVILCLLNGGKIVGLNIGSVMAMLLVGRVMGIFNKLALDKINKIVMK